MWSKRDFLRRGAVLSMSLAAPFAATAADNRPGAGDLPPNEVGRGLDGDMVELKSFAGKAIVVSFWATWCPYCLKELPILQGIQSSAGLDKMRVIAINTETHVTFRRAASVLSDSGLLMTYDPGQRAQSAFGVHGIPHMVIVGRDGKIVSVYRGYGESSLDAIVADINRALVV